MFNDVYIFSKLKGPGCDSIPTEVTEETDCSTIRVSPALLREQHPKKQSHRNKAGPQEQQLQYSWRHTHTHQSAHPHHHQPLVRPEFSIYRSLDKETGPLNTKKG